MNLQRPKGRFILCRRPQAARKVEMSELACLVHTWPQAALRRKCCELYDKFGNNFISNR